jgi:hypothetical protein
VNELDNASIAAFKMISFRTKGGGRIKSSHLNRWGVNSTITAKISIDYSAGVTNLLLHFHCVTVHLSNSGKRCLNCKNEVTIMNS